MSNSHLPLRASSPRPRPEVWIEVARGRTRFPRRPVTGERLLIGAGSNCQLQLGGDGMPFLHSILVVEQQVEIEAFVPHPELRVNGQSVRTATLQDGDRLTIGVFEFSVHIEAGMTPQEVEDLYAPIPLEVAHEEEAEDVASLSASELVAKIESAESEIEEFETGRRAGAAALPDAAWLAGEPAAAGAAEGSHSEVLLLRELLGLSQDLERRLADLRQQEQEHAARAAALLAAQEKLAEQLRAARESVEAPQTLRASA